MWKVGGIKIESAGGRRFFLTKGHENSLGDAGEMRVASKYREVLQSQIRAHLIRQFCKISISIKYRIDSNLAYRTGLVPLQTTSSPSFSTSSHYHHHHLHVTFILLVAPALNAFERSTPYPFQGSEANDLGRFDQVEGAKGPQNKLATIQTFLSPLSPCAVGCASY